MCIILKFPLHSWLLAAVVHVMRWVEKCRQQSRKWQCRNEPLPSMWAGCDAVPVGCWRHCVWRWWTWCGGFWWAAAHVIVNGTNPENGQQHDDESQLQWVYWLPESDTNQSKAEQGEITEISSVMFGLSLAYTLQCIIMCYYSMILINTLCLSFFMWRKTMGWGVVGEYRYLLPPAGQTG